jgi:hypothetical protein
LQVSYRKAVDAMARRLWLDGYDVSSAAGVAQDTMRHALSVKQRARLQTPDPRR